MNNRTLKGIALIFFGMLVCLCGPEINSTLLYSFTDFPFSLLGLISGCIGLVIIFKKTKEEK